MYKIFVVLFVLICSACSVDFTETVYEQNINRDKQYEKAPGLFGLSF